MREETTLLLPRSISSIFEGDNGMQETPSASLCSIISCTQAGVSTMEAELAGWTITAHFCHEHGRQLEQGTPMSGAGLDACRLTATPLGEAVPDTGTSGAFSPQ